MFFDKKRNLAILTLLFAAQMAFAQQTVTGVVEDMDGNPLPGASILIKGERTGTVTDDLGRYTLKVNNPDAILVFQYLGFKTVEKMVPKNEKLNVTLKEDNLFLEETIVIGYADVKRRDLTGSVGKVNVDDMLKAGTANFDQALAGRIAGVQVSSAEGMPGSSMQIVIRGNNSLTQGNTPLYVIDGFPSEDPDIAASISPSDIQSIDILKDASATAIYGARGANGVVMINTKRGQVGKMKVNYNMTAGVQMLSKKLQMMDAYEFVKLQSEIMPASDLTNPKGGNGYFQLDKNGKQWTLDDYRNIEQYDWQDHIFRPAMVQSQNVSVNGGSNEVRYNSSFNYYDQDGIVFGSNYQKINGRINAVLKRNRLTLNITANMSHTEATGSSPSQNNYSGMNNLFYSVLGYRPVTSPNQPLSSLLDNIMDSSVDQTTDYRFNPVLSLDNEYNKRLTSALNLNVYAEYEIIDGLKVKISGVYTDDSRRNEVFNNSKTRNGYPGSANGVNGSLGIDQRAYFLNENTISYSTVFKKRHNFNALLGVTLQENSRKVNNTGYKNLPFESLGMAGISLGTLASTSSSITESSLLSFLARVNYNYASKYYLTASFRADGSSKFDKSNRWGYFPSMSAAWNISNENFFKPYRHVVNDLKLRVGWGQTGNNRIGEYDRFALLDMRYANYGNYTVSNGLIHSVYPDGNNPSNVGVSPISLSNKDLKWETTTQANVGVDMSFFDSNLNVTLDWYDKKTTDLLFFTEIPLSSGFGGVMKNIGAVGNRGLEITISTTNVERKNFKWTTDFNIAFNRNKVLSLADDVASKTTIAAFDNNFNTTPNYIAKVGYPMGMMYGFIYDGTYKLEDFDQVGTDYVLRTGVPYFSADGKDAIKPGYPKYRDLNGDGLIDNNDRTMIGRGEPIHTGGITNTFTFYGVDLSVFLQWNYGNDILNANRMIFESTFNLRKNLNQLASYADRWSFDNQDSDIPVPNASAGNNVFSTRVIEDGSYLRIKDIVLGYTFPKHLLNKLKLQKLRLYMSVQNLYTFTAYSGYDPEVSVRNTALTPGLDYSAYPRSTNVIFGLNIGF